MPGKKVLIVDDEKHIVTYLETLLQDNGYDTVAAYDGIEALEKVRTDKPDLVLLDITMPSKSGVRVYRELREQPETATIPVIIVTAVTGLGGKPEEFEKWISSRKQVPPPDAFIAKPIDRDAFLETVNRLLKTS